MLKTSSIPAATQAVELTDEDLDAVSGGWRRGGAKRTWRHARGTLAIVGLAVTSPWAAKRQKKNRSYKKAMNMLGD